MSSYENLSEAAKARYPTEADYLEMKRAAAAKGGARKVKKGFAKLSKKEAREIQRKGGLAISKEDI